MDAHYAGYGYQNHGNYQNRHYGGGNYQYRDQNRGGNFGYGDQFQQRSWYEEEDTSLKDMLKDYIHTQTAFGDWFNDSCEMINNKMEQEERNHQAWIQDLDRRLDIMEAEFENQLPVDLPIYAQPNPRTGQNDQRYEYVNTIYTQSEFSYGDEEERDGNEIEKFAELGNTAPQSYSLRRSESPEFFSVFANQYRSEPVSDSDFEEEEEEIEMDDTCFRMDDIDEATYDLDWESILEDEAEAEWELERVNAIKKEEERKLARVNVIKETDVEIKESAEVKELEIDTNMRIKTHIEDPPKEEEAEESLECEESDDLFNELDEIIMKEELEEFEDGKPVVETEESLEWEPKEFNGSKMEEVVFPVNMNITLEDFEQIFGVSKELVHIIKAMEVDKAEREVFGKELSLVIDIDHMTSDMLEDFLNMDDANPNQRIEQGDKASKEQVKVVSTQLGLGYEDEEKQNGKGKNAVLGTIAPQYPNQLRRNVWSKSCFSFIDQLDARESSPVQRYERSDTENNPEGRLGKDNQLENESMFSSKVEKRKMNANTYSKPIKKDLIRRETREWNDAVTKTRYEVDVSNRNVVFDDFDCKYVGDGHVEEYHEEGNRGRSRFQKKSV